MKNPKWRQLTIVHLTDLHFGNRHAFGPPIGPDGAPAAQRGRPTLAEALLRDIASTNPAPNSSTATTAESAARVVLAVTGDLTECADTSQFEDAANCIQELTQKLALSPRDVFIVPGNHDVVYDEKYAPDRWARYCRFYEKHVRACHSIDSIRFDPECPSDLTRIIDQTDAGLVVAEINSCAYVQKGTAGERRGEVDEEAIDTLDRQIKALNPDALRRSIRIALIHHHPVVLPGLAEPGEGYDAVMNSDLLLGLLKRHAFHVVLHGHKHTPHTFTYDAVCAWTRDHVRPLMVVAGGSAGSTQLRREPGSANTYNIVSLKWQPGAAQVRIRVETRGLVVHDDQGIPLPGPQWQWQPLRTDDRLLASNRSTDIERGDIRPRDASDLPYEKLRMTSIIATRRNYPVIEVMPSLNAKQGYEARVWIEAQIEKEEYEAPDQVVWSAGPWFPDVHVVERAQCPQFGARFSYHGPMLIQARLVWRDAENAVRHEALAYVFAHFPGQNGD
jgi:3',5'-cyclic AMP phosphodiesterase CpdA